MAGRATIANIIAAAKAAFPNYTPDPERTPLMFLAGLSDLPDELVKVAAESKIFEAFRVFAPSVGEIRGEAIRLECEAAGIPEAWQAYDEVLNKPVKGEICGEFTRLEDGTYGYPRSPIEWSHPIVEKTAYMMGWPTQFPSTEPGIDRAHFIKAYEAERERIFTNKARLPQVAEYVEARRLQIGNQPANNLIGKVVKKLEAKNE